MKKILLTAFFISGCSLFSANFTNSNDTAKTKQIKDKFTEYKIVNINGLEVCYERYCTITSVTGSDGVITEKKVCSEWFEVPCPTTPAPKPPTSLYT